MGEIADALIDGDGMCAGCGVYMEFADGPGFPLYCSRECAPDEEAYLLSQEYQCSLFDDRASREPES